MAKSFVIQCPDCGRYVEAQIGFFAKKTVKCSCGREINVKTDKMTTKICPHCGNEVMYDQSKGVEAVCPVCHKKINTEEDLYALVHFTCPSCLGAQTANKNAITHTCTLCGNVIDVKKRIAQEEMKMHLRHNFVSYLLTHHFKEPTFHPYNAQLARCLFEGSAHPSVAKTPPKRCRRP